MFLRRSVRRSCSWCALSIFRCAAQTFSYGARRASAGAKHDVPTAAGFHRGWRSVRPYVLGMGLMLALIGWLDARYYAHLGRCGHPDLKWPGGYCDQSRNEQDLRG